MWRPGTSCTGWLAWSVVAYYEQILRALPHVPIVRVEDSDAPCKVALHGGFVPPACRGVSIVEEERPLADPRPSGTVNRKNKRGLRLDWSDIEGELAARLRSLTKRLGYAVNTKNSK